MNYQKQYQTAMDGARGDGSMASAEFLRRTMSFDPQAAMRESAQGAFASMREQMGQDMADLRGSQVGAGRSRTGFANKDEDRLVSSAYDRLNNVLAQNSMAGAQMQMQNNQALGAYGQNATNNYYDMLAGAMDREQANKNAKRSMWGGIAGAALGAAGMALGGPAGGALGGWLGKQLGG
ncbi:MAG TPA: hypothetical protein VFX29_05290 [Longimicrobiaceae bacterium]|nr:hypothetical protein [Longimicrobiaceae bacterium]